MLPKCAVQPVSAMAGRLLQLEEVGEVLVGGPSEREADKLQETEVHAECSTTKLVVPLESRGSPRPYSVLLVSETVVVELRGWNTKTTVFFRFMLASQ